MSYLLLTMKNVSLSTLIIIAFSVLFFNFNSFGQSKKVYVSDIENRIKIGPVTGNRNFAFGIKNIFQEILQDKNLDIVENSEDTDYIISAEIMYFDVNRTKRNVSVFHSDKEETLVIIKGLIKTKEGKKIKEYVAEESSSEISTSTILTGEGSDTVNQQALSSAIKKTCESLINKLTEKI